MFKQSLLLFIPYNCPYLYIVLIFTRKIWHIFVSNFKFVSLFNFKTLSKSLVRAAKKKSTEKRKHRIPKYSSSWYKCQTMTKGEQKLISSCGSNVTWGKNGT